MGHESLDASLRCHLPEYVVAVRPDWTFETREIRTERCRKSTLLAEEGARRREVVPRSLQVGPRRARVEGAKECSRSRGTGSCDVPDA